MLWPSVSGTTIVTHEKFLCNFLLYLWLSSTSLPIWYLYNVAHVIVTHMCQLTHVSNINVISHLCWIIKCHSLTSIHSISLLWQHLTIYSPVSDNKKWILSHCLCCCLFVWNLCLIWLYYINISFPLVSEIKEFRWYNAHCSHYNFTTMSYFWFQLNFYFFCNSSFWNQGPCWSKT